MDSIARVNLWNVMVGAVAWSNKLGYATFEYDKDFFKKGWALAPLTMPLEEARSGNIFSFPLLNKETYHGLPGLLADSLPDKYGNRIIDAWLARQGRNPNSFNPVERLCYTGSRGMGALEYEPAIQPFSDISYAVKVKELVKLAREVLDERAKMHTSIHRNAGDGLTEIIRVGTSAGGARAKAVIAYNEKTGDVRSGQTDKLKGYSYWIIKFDGVSNKLLGDPQGYGKIEYAYHLMAKDCGITMPECRLLTENKRAHFMTKRFDRIGNKKLHLQTLCALAHFDYNDTASYSYEQAFQVMRLMKLPYPDMEELYRRMVFNVVARNQDDHTKNISFLMDEDSVWRLSPAYDVTYAYDSANKWMKAHQMSINGKNDFITRKDFMELASNMNIKKAEEIMEQVTDAVSSWAKYAKTAGVAPEQIKAIGKALILKI